MSWPNRHADLGEDGLQKRSEAARWRSRVLTLARAGEGAGVEGEGDAGCKRIESPMRSAMVK